MMLYQVIRVDAPYLGPLYENADPVRCTDWIRDRLERYGSKFTYVVHPKRV